MPVTVTVAVTVKSVELAFFDPSINSDKVYKLEIRCVGKPLEKDSASWLYDVAFCYGRRGSPLTGGRKNSAPVLLSVATRLYETLKREKLAKGYKIKIEDGKRQLDLESLDQKKLDVELNVAYPIKTLLPLKRVADLPLPGKTGKSVLARLIDTEYPEVREGTQVVLQKPSRFTNPRTAEPAPKPDIANPFADRKRRITFEED